MIRLDYITGTYGVTYIIKTSVKTRFLEYVNNDKTSNKPFSKSAGMPRLIGKVDSDAAFRTGLYDTFFRERFLSFEVPLRISHPKERVQKGLVNYQVKCGRVHSSMARPPHPLPNLRILCSGLT